MSDFNPKISLFKNARTNKPEPGQPSVDTMLDFIRDGVWQKEIEALRTVVKEEEYKELKKKLNAVTWSGTFTKRNLESLEQYSQLICMDIDHIPNNDMQQLRSLFQNDLYIYAFFTSPSGSGLKVLFRTDIAHVDSFADAWQAIALYILNTYGIHVDKACKDICRLCFVSYDPELYLNEGANTIDELFINAQQPAKPAPAPKPAAATTPTSGELTTDEKLALCDEWTRKDPKAQPGEGSYNMYINQFAVHANRFGLSQEECAWGIARYCGWAQPDKNDYAVIKSVYTSTKFSAEHGSKRDWNRKGSGKGNAGKHSAGATEPVSTNLVTTFDDSVVFWHGTGGEIVEESTGEFLAYKEYKYSYDDAIIFLENNGFYKYKHTDSSYQIIHVDKANNIVEIVDELRIYEFILSFLLSRPGSFEFKKVREMFRRGAKNYCSMYSLRGLNYFKPEMKRDDRDTAYVYFRNCFIEITAGRDVEVKQYSQLQGMIWRKQIIDHEYAPGENACDFSRFITYAITGRKATRENPYNEQEAAKMDSMLTTIGYLLHRYKSPATTKAVISVDKKIRRTGEANGRSGKSLFSKALGKMLNMVIIDGPNYKPDYEFALQQVNIDTELINFNDVTKNFDFTRLFGMITEELTFNKKKIDSITIPFADAPKFYISTNFTLKGDGESNKGRQQIIEFSTYFNTENTPAKEFGHMFFYDWDNTEWNRFYSFMCHCIKLYLEAGLLDFPLENYDVNKLIDMAGEDFVDFMDETVKVQIQEHNKTEFEVKELFNKYRELARKHELRQHTFTKNVRLWAKTNGYLLNADGKDGRVRRNSIDYYVFSPILTGDVPF